MKTLYIFGDSFSTNFSTINEIELEESWPILLSNKLGYELKSYASPGISNYGILNKIYDNLDLTEIDKSDIIIIGITFYDRLYDLWKNAGIDLKDGKLSGISENEMNFYKEKILDTPGMMQYIKNSLLQYYFIINSIKTITPNVLFWNIDICDLSVFKKMVELNNEHYIKPFDKKCWIDYCYSNPSWWQTNNDKHFGKAGHKEFFEYLYQYIEPKII
jgi:predicted DNA-binding transcriptional regulator